MKLSLVVWRDIQSLHTWSTKESVLDWGKKAWKEYQITTGEIILRNKEYVLVASTRDQSNEDTQYNDVQIIPMACVIKIVTK